MFNAIDLGNRIKYYRKNKNLSQKALGNLCNMAQSTISDLETGNIGTFNIFKLSIIADALNVSLDDLLCDSIDALQQNNVSVGSPYEIKLKQLLVSLEEEHQIEFSNHLIENFIKLKQLSKNQKN